MTQVVHFYESERDTIVNWSMAEPSKEIRTIFINWPAYNLASLTGEMENLSMIVKPIKKFEKYDVEDFGLKATDTDSHIPGFYIIRKTRTLSHADYHSRSEAGRRREAERRKEKRNEKRAHYYE